MRLSYYILFVVASVLMSCQPVEIDADLPDRDGLITITSLFQTDSLWRVDVYSSKSILESKAIYGAGAVDLEPITNAQVTLREDGQTYDQLIYSTYKFVVESKTYMSSKPELRPLAGKTYDIEVTVPGVGTATSACYIPLPVRLLSAKAGRTVTNVDSRRINGSSIDHTTFAALATDIVIDDPAGENYYELAVKFYPANGQNPYHGPAPGFTKNLRFHNTGINNGSLLPGTDDIYYSIIFSDKDPEAKQMNLSFMMPTMTNSDQNGIIIEDGDRHTVVLRTLSKEYFQYLASQELQAYSNNDPFAQPVVIFGNVKGGLGIFAGFSEYEMEVEVE